MKSRIAAFFVFLLLLPVTFARPCSAQITVKIVNDSGVNPDDVYLLLTGDSSKPITTPGITPNISTKLSALANNQFMLSAISSGRLIFSFNGPVASDQQPIVSSYRFDKVEMTYPGAANLTAVDFFGIPFRLETFDTGGNLLQKLTYYASKNTLAAELLSLAPNALITTDGMASGPFARILAPSLSPSSYPDMNAYVDSVAGKQVTISGTYVGPKAPTPNTYHYSGTFENNGSITLSGTMAHPADPADKPLTIDGSTLPDAIYTNNGPYTVATATDNPQNVSKNDVYAAIYRDLVAGFDFGYLNGVYGSNSKGWYGTTPYNPPYACARATNDGFYNKYASLIAANSDAYGFPFSDLLEKVQVGLNPSNTNSVATLRITVLPDNALDAPIIQSEVLTEDSITVTWKPISGATDYRVQVSPPLPAQVFDVGASTTHTIPNLKPGTPYTVSVVASNATSSSEAIPVVATTKGIANRLSGSVGWHFIAFFTGSFPGNNKVTFNGVTKTLPDTLNPTLTWDSPAEQATGNPGQKNAYVFDWKDEQGRQIYNTILYVTLKSSPSSDLGAINKAPSATFMAANQNLPTYDTTDFNLFLSIAPTIQRKLCTTGP